MYVINHDTYISSLMGIVVIPNRRLEHKYDCKRISLFKQKYDNVNQEQIAFNPSMSSVMCFGSKPYFKKNAITGVHSALLQNVEMTAYV